MQKGEETLTHSPCACCGKDLWGRITAFKEEESLTSPSSLWGDNFAFKVEEFYKERLLRPYNSNRWEG